MASAAIGGEEEGEGKSTIVGWLDKWLFGGVAVTSFIVVGRFGGLRRRCGISREGWPGFNLSCDYDMRLWKV